MHNPNSFSFGPVTGPEGLQPEVKAEHTGEAREADKAFLPAEITALESGPLNHVGWLIDGFGHPAIKFLSPEARERMHEYATMRLSNSSTEEERARHKALASEIVRDVEVAGELYLDQQEAL